jgi:5-hydroxyisourate hydrolase-like protein (transthyretin family)
MNRALLLLLLAAAARAQTVQGVVLNAATHKPVAGATVELTGVAAENTDPDIYRAQSDAAGRFKFERVIPGRYRAAAIAQGFLRMGDRAARVNVQSGAQDVTLAITPRCVISGRVTDPDGDPLPFVSVEAVHYGYQGGKKALINAAGVTTNDRGEYRLFDLPPGRYYLRAIARSGPALGHAPVYFPAASAISDATLLEASPTGEVRSIDLVLRPGQVHSITGRVVDGQTGQPVANVYVVARLNNESFSNGSSQMKDGFTVANLAPGRYIVSAQEFSGDSSLYGRVTVDLGSADVTGVVLTLTRGLEISGAVRVLSGNMRLSLEAKDGGVTFNATVAANGTFVFKNVMPDLFRLVWSLPKGTYVKSIKFGDRLLKDDRLDLTGPAAPLSIQLADDGGRVQGTVRNAAGEPVPGAIVTMSASPSYDFWSATADDTGNFEIRDIAPGDYKLLAFQDAPDGATYDPDFRQPFEKNAARLQVLPSTQQKIDLVTVGISERP